MDGRRLAARFREVEVEVVGSAPDYLLNAVVARLGEAGAIAGDGRSKVARAIGPRAAEPADVTPVSVDESSSISEVVRAAIAHGYLRLVGHDLGVRLDEDPEDVHQARVATRRLRSDLRTFRAYLPDDWALDIRAELGWLAEALGRARDADVLFERLHGQVGSLDPRDAEAAGALLGRLVAEQGDAREALLKVLDTDRYGALLDRLAAAAQELPPMKAPDDLGLVAVVTTAGEEPAGESRPAADPAAGGLPTAVLSPVSGGADQASGGVQMAGLTASGEAPVTLGAEAAGGDGASEPGSGGGDAASGSESAGGDAGPTAASGAGHAGGALSIPDRDAPARQEAPAIVRGPWRHLSRAVHALGPAPSDEALHEVRIRAKRLRYASEAVAPAVGKPALELARSAADVQGVLGDFHDAIVAEDWLRTGTAGRQSGPGPGRRPAHRPGAGRRRPVPRLLARRLEAAQPQEAPGLADVGVTARGRPGRVRSGAGADRGFRPGEQLLPSAGRRRPPGWHLRAPRPRQGDAPARECRRRHRGGQAAAAGSAAVEVVRRFRALAESLRADEMVACGTAALREARDSAAVVDRIEAETGDQGPGHQRP